MLDQKILEMREDIIRGVQSAIRIKSVTGPALAGMPFGAGAQESLAHCLELAQSLGFEAVNVDNMLGYAEYGAGAEMIAVLGHLDVVPEGGGWTYPPYGAEIHDGKIYGRGAIDDKGPTIGALYALKAVKDLGLPLKRRVRVLFGLDEETGSRCVRHYVEQGGEIPVAGFTPDAEYPIINGEKGIVTCTYRRALRQTGDLTLKRLGGGSAANVVPDHAEAELALPADQAARARALAAQTAEIEVEPGPNGLLVQARGASAHGSMPEKGKNAIALLLQFLGKLEFTGDLADFLHFMNSYIGMDLHGERLGIYSEDEISGKFIFNLGVIAGDAKEIKLEINMRYPVTHTFDEFITTFRQKMQLGKLEEHALRHKNSVYTPPDTWFIKELQRVYETKTGDTADLLAIGGGTYAKALPNIVAFGPVFRGQPVVEHMPDEYIGIAELIKNVQIMAAAMVALAN